MLLMPLMAASFPPEALAQFRAVAAAAPANSSDPAVVTARAFTASHADWIRANEERERLRAQLHALFGELDVLLLPVNQLPAIPHMHEPPMPLRTLAREREDDPLHRPARLDRAGHHVQAARERRRPSGRTAENLPVGIQIVGSHLEDRTTLDFARRLAELSGGFTPPPGF